MSDADVNGLFAIDEEPLRQWILKAYHEKRDGDPRERKLLDEMRAFLSGAIGGLSSPRYRFEDTPRATVTAFAAALDATRVGLTAQLLEPLFQSLEPVGSNECSSRANAARATPALAPNLSVFIAFLAGPIALRSGLDETLVCALLSTWLLALARLGRFRVKEYLGGDT